MKKHIPLALLLMSCFFLPSCREKYNPYLRSFAFQYTNAQDLITFVKPGEPIIFISLDPSEDKTVTARDKDKKKERFDALCKAHNDVDYNRRVNIPGGHMTNQREYLAPDIERIEVISNKDFDEQHPAGTLLNDCILFLTVSPRKYIDSKYTETFDWKRDAPASFRRARAFFTANMDDTDAPYHHPIEKLLSEMKPEDYYFIGGWIFGCLGVLIFDQTEVTGEEHLLSIRVYHTDGKVLTEEVGMTF